jgi:hypothetical protein
LSLVSDSLPSLANGVSQQPPTARLSSQGEEQLNGYSSIVEGLGKRAPTYHVAKILDGQVGELTVHLINRDVEERYDVVVSNGFLQVFDLDGDEKDVVVQGMVAIELVPTTNTTVTGEAFQLVFPAGVTSLDNLRIITVSGTPTVTAKLEGSVDGSTGWTQIGSDYSASTESPVSIGSTFKFIRVRITAISGGSVRVTSTWQHFRYLLSEEPSTAIRAVTIADYTFLVNTETEVELGAADTLLGRDEAVIYVKQGNYGTIYDVRLEQVIGSGTFYFATKTTSNTVVTDIDTSNIAAGLNTTLNAIANFNTHYTTVVSGSTIKVTRLDGADFKLICADGNGNRNMIGIKNQIQKFTDLPPACFLDFRIKIIGDTAADEDDYYVKFNGGTTSSAGTGVWEEVAATGIQNSFNAETMPHQLIRQEDGSFVFQAATWDARPAGDEESNPAPTFVGTVINDIVFFRNRLGFLADENVITSAAGPNYFRFFRATVTTLLDGDPIDVAASNVSVSILKNAVPFSEDKMLCFSDQKQFVFTGGDLLTPKTASCKQSTAYEATPGCKPVAVGKAVYFATPQGDNSGLREYLIDATTAVADAQDVTAHVPSYIPANVFKIAAAPNESVMILLTRDDPDNLYVYKYYFVENNKLQASWSKWPMAGEVLDANFIGSTLHLAVQREDGVYLERIGIEAFRNDTNSEFELRLDRRFAAGPGGTVTGTYNTTTDLTTFALPYETAETVQAVVRDNGAIPAGYYEHQLLAVTKLNTNTSITIAGDVSAVPLNIGVQYSFVYDVSEIVLRQAAGQGGERPVTGGRLQIRNMKLVYDRTGYFRVEVTPTFGDTYTYTFTPKTLGEYISGSFELQAGEFTFPVLAKSDQVTVRIINDSPYPARFLSASWEGEYVKKSRQL